MAYRDRGYRGPPKRKINPVTRTGGRGTTFTPPPVKPATMYGTLGNYVQPPNPYMSGTLGNYGPQQTRITTGPFAQQPGYMYNPTAPNSIYAQQQQATKPVAKAGVTGGGTVRQHGYHQYIMNQIYGKQGYQPVVEAAGTTASVGPEYPSGGGYGGGYYDYGGGGGGYSYPGYNNAFNRFRQGYGVQGATPQVAMGARAVPQQTPYRGYATANQAARWIALLTNWRIG